MELPSFNQGSDVETDDIIYVWGLTTNDQDVLLKMQYVQYQEIVDLLNSDTDGSKLIANPKNLKGLVEEIIQNEQVTQIAKDNFFAQVKKARKMLVEKTGNPDIENQMMEKLTLSIPSQEVYVYKSFIIYNKTPFTMVDLREVAAIDLQEKKVKSIYPIISLRFKKKMGVGEDLMQLKGNMDKCQEDLAALVDYVERYYPGLI